MTSRITTAPAEGAPTGPSASLRERKKQETRSAIHEAALRLVAENGVERASVDAICSEAGVSSRTFFNYFPSKLTAVIGLSGFEITEAHRARFLEGAGEKDLMRDLCLLMKELTDSAARIGPDRGEVRELLSHRPELVHGLFGVMIEMRHELVELAAQRTGPTRARLAIALLMSALSFVMDTPRDSRVDDLDERLLAAIAGIRELAAESSA